MSDCRGQATSGENSFFGTITAVGGGSGAGALALSHCSFQITVLILLLLCQLPEFLYSICSSMFRSFLRLLHQRLWLFHYFPMPNWREWRYIIPEFPCSLKFKINIILKLM